MSPVADVILECQEIKQQLHHETYKLHIYDEHYTICNVNIQLLSYVCKNKQLIQKKKMQPPHHKITVNCQSF